MLVRTRTRYNKLTVTTSYRYLNNNNSKIILLYLLFVNLLVYVPGTYLLFTQYSPLG